MMATKPASDWLIFCETDRTTLLAAAAERCGAPVVRPADALGDIIEEVLGVTLVTGPVLGGRLGHCNYDRARITINERMAHLVRPNTDIEGLTHSTIAHELAHLRLPHHEVEVRRANRRRERLAAAVEARHEDEADAYAGIFLVPTSSLWSMPGVMVLLDAQGSRATASSFTSDTLWDMVRTLARSFRVTGGLMARRLVHLGLIEYTEGRRLRLASPVR